MIENDQVAGGSSTIPIYDDLLPIPIKSEESELKLKENVVYNSTQITEWHCNSPAN